jgi:Tfp pilus assembly protein PilP
MKLVLLFMAVLMISACSTVQQQNAELLNQIKSACKSGVEQFDNGSVSFSCLNMRN